MARNGHVGTMLAPVPFRVDVEREDGTLHVCPVGEVDMATIGHLRERITAAVGAGTGRVILDLRKTTFLDSKGLHLAMDLDTWAARNGTEFAIIAGPRAVQRTFEIAGLSERLPFLALAPGEVPSMGSASPAARQVA